MWRRSALPHTGLTYCQPHQGRQGEIFASIFESIIQINNDEFMYPRWFQVLINVHLSHQKLHKPLIRKGQRLFVCRSTRLVLHKGATHGR